MGTALWLLVLDDGGVWALTAAALSLLDWRWGALAASRPGVPFAECVLRAPSPRWR